MKIDLLDTPTTEDVRIEIIPLVDVIFCILTFFILAAVGLTRQQAIDLDLPSANSGSPLPAQGLGADAVRRGRLYVSVDAIGQVYLDQQPVTLDLLNDVLLQHQQVSPEGLIVLYASRDARYEDVIQVLDLLRSVGGDRVALATLPSAIGDPANALSGDDLLDPNLWQDPSLTPGTDPLVSPLTDPLAPGEDPLFDSMDSLDPLDENP
ncbi:MAG: biopolymer transporter ExbD [Cyanobacteria bacterium]|nr:biopolymer transporter ExbD [Cyanobacteriota bacterium]MDA0865397.1 biopolymer transporter ExbD [Cyanobacteriota bacterium]